LSRAGFTVEILPYMVDFRPPKNDSKAAIEAGERRMRPIFLTTMAAAVGVTPMILSGSSMWSPNVDGPSPITVMVGERGSETFRPGDFASVPRPCHGMQVRDETGWHFRN
jgi:hypothetical protein